MKINNVLRIILPMLLILFVLCDFVYIHESTHAEVNKIFGCDSEIVYGLNKSLTYSYCPPSMNDTALLKLAQANVDAYGYQISLFGITTFAILLYMYVDRR